MNGKRTPQSYSRILQASCIPQYFMYMGEKIVNKENFQEVAELLERNQTPVERK